MRLGGQHLDRGHDQAQISRLLKLVFQPGPLVIAQHVLFGVSGWQVTLLAFGAIGICWRQRRAKETRIQHDDLRALTLLPETARVIGARPCADILVLKSPEAFMNALCETAERELPPGIVCAIIMIVPCHHHRVGGAYRLEIFPRGQFGKALAQLVQIGLIVGIGHAILVAIHIVADHQEQVGFFRGDLFKRGGRPGLFLIMAGANKNSRQGRVLCWKGQSLRRAWIELIRQGSVISLQCIFRTVRRARNAGYRDRPRRLTCGETCNKYSTDNTFHENPSKAPLPVSCVAGFGEGCKGLSGSGSEEYGPHHPARQEGEHAGHQHAAGKHARHMLAVAGDVFPARRRDAHRQADQCPG